MYFFLFKEVSGNHSLFNNLCLYSMNLGYLWAKAPWPLFLPCKRKWGNTISRPIPGQTLFTASSYRVHSYRVLTVLWGTAVINVFISQRWKVPFKCGNRPKLCRQGRRCSEKMTPRATLSTSPPRIFLCWQSNTQIKSYTHLIKCLFNESMYKNLQILELNYTWNRMAG